MHAPSPTNQWGGRAGSAEALHTRPTAAAIAAPASDHTDDWGEEKEQFQCAAPSGEEATLDTGGSSDWDDDFQGAAAAPESGAIASRDSLPGPHVSVEQSAESTDDTGEASISLREAVEPGGAYDLLPGLAESQQLILQVNPGPSDVNVLQAPAE